MKKFKGVVFKLTLALAALSLMIPQLGCHGGASGNNVSAVSGLKHFRTDVNPGSPYYQYTGNIQGNIPFSPQYKPLSVSHKTGNTRENSGALIYTDYNGSTFVLLGLEKQNSFWNIMRGSVEKGDDYVKTAAKELHEETAGVYKVTEQVLLNETYDVYLSATTQNSGCTFFVKMPYVPATDILTSAQNHAQSAFKEMKDYRWISLDSLRSGIATGNEIFQATTETGQSEQIHMYRYTYLILTQAEQKGILKNLY